MTSPSVTLTSKRAFYINDAWCWLVLPKVSIERTEYNNKTIVDYLSNRLLLSLNKDSGIVKGSNWPEDGAEMTREGSNCLKCWGWNHWKKKKKCDWNNLGRNDRRPCQIYVQYTMQIPAQPFNTQWFIFYGVGFSILRSKFAFVGCEDLETRTDTV